MSSLLSPPLSFPSEAVGWAGASAAAQRRALLELGRRADRGTWIHPALWVLLALVGDCHRVWPELFWLNNACFVGMALWRLHLMRERAAMADQGLGRATQRLVAALVLSALHWGLTALVVLSNPELASSMRDLLYIVMGALAASGTMVLAIHPVVRRWYAWAVVAPAQLWLVANPNMEDLFVLVASLLMVIYIVKASAAVYDDYWTAAEARQMIERHAAQMERLSAFDALTQVHNRFSFDRQLEALWATAARQRTPLALLLVDVDHFKRLNDTWGHVAGDRALRRTADALRVSLRRECDLLARYGGEEFVVLLPDTDLAEALAFGEQLRAAVAAQHHEAPLAGVKVTCSIGVHALLPRGGQDPVDLLRGADEALYAAKGAGRNRVHPQAEGLR